jgi:hypothetical protein
VAPGVDRIFPSASYMFIQTYIYNDRDYFYNVGQKGIGIDSNLENVIKNVILTYETTSTCGCYSSDISSISSALGQFDGNSWTVLCSEQNDMYALAYSFAKKYIYTRPKVCSYIVYAP